MKPQQNNLKRLLQHIQQPEEHIIQVPIESVMAKENLLPVYGLDPKKTVEPVIAMPYTHNDPSMRRIKWLVAVLPKQTSNKISIRVIPGLNKSNLAPVTFFRGNGQNTSDRDPVIMYEVISYLLTKMKMGDISLLAKLDRQILTAYLSVADIDPVLWTKDERAPAMLAVTWLAKIPLNLQKEIWDQVNHLPNIEWRATVVSEIAKRMSAEWIAPSPETIKLIIEECKPEE
ncbi:MAG: hypothetical protein V4509_04885 [Patescibacteria group bacterium]